MVDVKSEIIAKFPALKNRSPMLKESLFKIAQKIIHENKINEFLAQHSHLEGFEFVEAVLDFFAFDFSYSSNDIENIPSTGRVVIIANHNYKKDLKVLKSSLKSIDAAIPTLYKQYGDLCEYSGLTFHGFNIDSAFSNCIDGFILVEISKIKKSKRGRYMT